MSHISNLNIPNSMFYHRLRFLTILQESVPCHLHRLPYSGYNISGIPCPSPFVVFFGAKQGGNGANLVKIPNFGRFALENWPKNTKNFRLPSAAGCAQNKGGRG